MKKDSLIFALALFVIFSINIFAYAEPVKIGFGWVGKASMPERVTKGFLKGIDDLGADIEIEYRRELMSMSDLGDIVSRWQMEKKAMVILRSNAAEWLAKNPPKIPTFIGACNHPGQLGVVNNLNAPEGNVTGVTYFISVEKQFDLFQRIIPQIKSVLLLLEKGHPSSDIDKEETKDVCSKRGISYNDRLCSSKDEAVEVVKFYRDDVSLIIIGSQALNLDNAENIVKAAGATPVVSYSSRPVKVGALCGLVASDDKLGHMLAQSLVDVVIKGKIIKDVPVKFDPAPKVSINIETANRLGIKIPYDILKEAEVVGK
ncbi:MAG: ABC transporter substrate binding protein [Candidatus Omnitrophota bacterium]